MQMSLMTRRPMCGISRTANPVGSVKRRLTFIISCRAHWLLCMFRNMPDSCCACQATHYAHRTPGAYVRRPGDRSITAAVQALKYTWLQSRCMPAVKDTARAADLQQRSMALACCVLQADADRPRSALPQCCCMLASVDQDQHCLADEPHDKATHVWHKPHRQP